MFGINQLSKTINRQLILDRQNISTLVQDLAVYDKEIYFWNWKKDTMHLMLRFNKDFYGLFKFGADLSEIIAMRKKIEEPNQIDITINN